MLKFIHITSLGRFPMSDYTSASSWIIDSMKSQHLRRTPGVDSALSELLAPFAGPQFGPTQPMHLFGGHPREAFMKKTSLITSLDGLIPLCYFFKYVTPLKFSPTLLIPKDFWFIVPPTWRDKVKLYEVKSSTIYSAQNPPKRMIMCGSFNSFMSDEDMIESELEKLIEALGGEDPFSQIETALFFTSKSDGISDFMDEGKLLSYSHKLLRHFKQKITFPRFDAIRANPDYRDTLYYEINNRKYISETFSKHVLFSKGAGSLFIDDEKNDLGPSHSIKLSPYHHIDIFELKQPMSSYEIFESSEFYNAHFKFFQLGSQQETINEKWDHWFKDYLMRIFS